MKKFYILFLFLIFIYISSLVPLKANICDCAENGSYQITNPNPESNPVTDNSKDIPEGEKSIKVNLYSRSLTLYIDGEPYKSYPVTIGEEDSESPVGEWTIINKFPRNEDGPFGSRWMGLNVPWGVYGIHGTNKPEEIGMAASEGCIRLHNQHIEELYEWVPMNTYVEIIGPRKNLDINYEMKPGDTGRDVRELQYELREYGFTPGYLDGKYGEKTEKAVNELKSQFNLKIDGVSDLNVVNILDLPDE